MWIYEHNDWPDFSWDADALAAKLAEVNSARYRLLGRMENLGFSLRQEASLNTLTSDVVKTSAIEGEHLNAEQVRSSIALRLGMDVGELAKPSRDVDAIVDLMLDATRNYAAALTKDRLFTWHSTLFQGAPGIIHPITVGKWRTGPMQVVSGPLERRKVHYEAPAADKMESEMAKFLDWFNSVDGGGDYLDPVLKAGIAHLWFIIIHPFDDGNGRIARAISDMTLARADRAEDRVYSLSTQIESERKDYYAHLQKQQSDAPQITEWLEWFLDCLLRAVRRAETSLEEVLFKARLWEKINQGPVNERQRLIINRMLDADFVGVIKTSKYARMAKCSNNTALRDIQDLEARGILMRNPGGGRSVSYRICDTC